MITKRCWEDTEGNLWKLIRENEKDCKGQTFKRLTWVYPCGGAVEYRESVDEKGNRIYIVEAFEVSPKSWAEERLIVTHGSCVCREKRNGKKEEAVELAREWRNSVIPCEVCETEKQTVFRFKTGVKPFTVKRVQIASRV